MDTVDHVHLTLARALAAVAAAVVVSVPAAVAGAAAASTAPAAASTAPATASRAAATPGHVVVVGIGGLRWSDISPSATPTLWRLAGQGSDGSLIVRGAVQHTCPADDWLSLNVAAKAAVPHDPAGPCPAAPRVVTRPASAARGPGSPAPATVPGMPGLISFNTRYSQNPQWGLLRSAVGPGHCATAAGPGAALALATRTGQVTSYLPAVSALTRADLARCALTVVDLGNLPPAAARAGGEAARAAAVRADDARLAVLGASLPARTILMIAGLGDGGVSHLHAIIVTGPGYPAGLLAAASTRQPGMVVITDLTPTVLHRLGAPVPAVAVGSQVRSAARASLPATVRMLAGQDTAAQVYRSTMAPFFLLVGFGYPVLFALIWAIPWGRGEERRRRRRAVARVAGVWAAALPVGTFLASLVPWWGYPHPAAVLYSVSAAWAALVAAAALAGPWRRDPLGPVGMVAGVTLGVIALDLMTGSHLQPETPFGLAILLNARFYGLGNNAVVIYAASAIVCATWLAQAALRQGRRRRALAVMAAVLALAVSAAGWPGFGAKVGGTIAMVTAFLLLFALAARIRITVRRGLLIAVSGLAVVTLFALVNYFLPVTGHSDIGGFVGQALHGGAGSILARKAGSNLHSLTENPFVVVIPVVVAALGVIIAWPTRVRAHLLARAYGEIPLLRPAFTTVWLVGVLGWFVEDSGVTVPAAALPFVLPLAIVILSSLPAPGGVGTPAPHPAKTPGADGAPAAGGPAQAAGDRATQAAGDRRAQPGPSGTGIPTRGGDRTSPGPPQPG